MTKSSAEETLTELEQWLKCEARHWRFQQAVDGQDGLKGPAAFARGRASMAEGVLIRLETKRSGNG